MPEASRCTGVVTKPTMRVTGEGLPVTPLYSADRMHSTTTTATPMKKREPNLFRLRKSEYSFPRSRVETRVYSVPPHACSPRRISPSGATGRPMTL